MKAPDFCYQRPASLAAALDMLDTENDSQLLAGGQSLMPMMNFRMSSPDVLIDLNALTELDFITEHSQTIEIGSMTRYTQLLQSPVIRHNMPLFAQAIPHIAHPAIRNRGTIGGSVALADPAAEMPALLKALQAELLLVSRTTERSVPADDFITGIYETVRNDNEIIQSISVRKTQPGNAYGFHELTRRHGDYAMAGAVVAADSLHPLSGVRIVLFGVSHCALRATAAEQALDGHTLDNKSAVAAAIATLSQIEFTADLHQAASTRQHLAGVALQRALNGMQI